MVVVYVVGCPDRSLYIGHTENLSAREETHNSGSGATYTASRRPVRIIYSERFDSPEEALNRERQLKRSTLSKKKEDLIRGDRERLKPLSRSRSRQDKSV